MNLRKSANRLAGRGLGLALILGAALYFATPQHLLSGPQDQARITHVTVEDGQVVVIVSIPEGLRKITLESRPTSGPGVWQPRAVARIQGEPAEITFRLPLSRDLELLRVRGDASEPLPAAFYQGETAFNPEPGYGYDVRYYDGALPTAGPEDDTTNTGDREVVESDIWKLRENTLHVFNQYRGLQLVDVSNPDTPELLSSLDLPARGEEMYLLGDQHAILLASDRCTTSPYGPESEIYIVQTDIDPPAVAAVIPLTGSIRESRLVGSVLYVATESYQYRDTDDTWSWGITLSAHDLSDPSAPLPGDRLRFAGSGLQVNATPQFFFVAAQQSVDRTRHFIRCFDITDPAGRMVETANFPVFGTLADKFKMDWHEGILRVVSARWDTTARLWLNRLETFRLPAPDDPQPLPVARLGSIDLGAGERLFATRFDGTRAYVVTYFVIDPLWIVDLADPLRPQIVGELHVPGWSTYIHPMGELLLAMGIDDTDGRRAAVSLFDVSNPAQPSLARRISLGDGYSWSEANATEKAFTVLPNQHLVLVPYTGENDGTYASRVQLIDFDPSTKSLVARGEVLHRFSARRTLVHQERMLSISDVELLSVDITDRDQPTVTAELTLAWPSDELFLQGDYVLQLARGNSWTGDPAAVRIAEREDPQTALHTATLTEAWPVLGAAVRGDRFLVLQGLTEGYGPPLEDPDPEATPNLALTVFDLSQLPDALPVVGLLQAEVASLGWGGDYQFLWPDNALLVLAGGGYGGWYYPYWDIALDAPLFMPRFYYGGAGGGGNRFIAIDLTDPTTPALLSDLTLENPDAYGFTAAHVAGSLVYTSHAVAVEPGPIEVVNETTGEWEPILPPDGFRVIRYALDVIDYAYPARPDVRDPVPLPGRLEAIGRNGHLLYTRGQHWEPNPDWSYDSQEWIDALAYDGVKVYRVASLPIPLAWPQPVLIQTDQVYLGRASDAGEGSGDLERWQLTDAGEFQAFEQLPLKQLPYSLTAVGDLLLGSTYQGLAVIDVGNPDALANLGVVEPQGCLWLDPLKAKGSHAQGLWFPIGLYGVQHIALPEEAP